MDSNLTKEEAQKLEQKYILEFNTFYLNGNGYNMTHGGDWNDHLKGSLNVNAILTEDQVKTVILLLKTTNLEYKDILLQIGLDDTDNNRSIITRINGGYSYVDNEETYPLRQDGRVLNGSRKIGANNPQAKLTDFTASQVIKLLEQTSLSQSQIAKQYGVSLNTVNLINRCLLWTHLHTYKNNIRQESYNKGE